MNRAARGFRQRVSAEKRKDRMINRAYAGIAAAVLTLAIAAAPIAAQAPVQVPRSVLERYVGEYGENGTTRVLIEGNTLVQETPGQRVALVPISETLFRTGAIFTVEFVTDQAGGVTQVLSNGVDFENRIPRRGSRASPPPAAPGPAMRVPRPVLERYVGTYEFLPGQMSRTDLRFTIRLEGDTLIRNMQQEAVLTPLSETRFRVGNTSLVTEFVVDEAGVTQVMGSGFQQMLARLTPQR
jgi:hypothetical protein